ncbi:MAG: tetratricopeptide repeat protein [Candidatus Competibacteraceae bacterium]|nr:tetratricopeptide repeat protein [Candidatus Competibacteraceae bacterium]
MKKLQNPRAMAIALALSSALLNIQTVSAADRDQVYLERAVSSLEQGDLRTGVIELKNALQQNPDNAQARLLLGKTYLQLGDPVAAEKELRRARDLAVGRQQWLPPLGEAYLAQSQFQRLLDEITLEADDPKPLQAQALALQGLAELGRGDRETARARLSRALELDDGQINALLGLARLTINDDPQQAQALLERALDKQPDSFQVWQLQGQLHQAQGEHKAAIEAFDRVLTMRP